MVQYPLEDTSTLLEQIERLPGYRGAVRPTHAD
jgi:hypothetical protein